MTKIFRVTYYAKLWPFKDRGRLTRLMVIGRALFSDLADVPALVHQADAVKGDLLPEGEVVGEGRDLVVKVSVASQKNWTLKAVLVPLNRVL